MESCRLAFNLLARHMATAEYRRGHDAQLGRCLELGEAACRLVCELPEGWGDLGLRLMDRVSPLLTGGTPVALYGCCCVAPLGLEA